MVTDRKITKNCLAKNWWGYKRQVLSCPKEQKEEANIFICITCRTFNEAMEEQRQDLNRLMREISNG